WFTSFSSHSLLIVQKQYLNHRAHQGAARYTEKPIFKKFGLSFSSSMLSVTSVVRKKSLTHKGVTL
ncbi:hypothetical protein, partial [Pseudoalteromonas sp. bablab_jr004]|uniref:hypothetical protein n=1 Tax=Pseudoalteromonas sp. bablab_jr004 TaxID=2755065 RepID=UPI001A7E322A